MTQSRLSFFIEDLLVGCHDVTELGRAGHVASRVACTRSSGDLRTPAEVAIRILGKVCK